MPPGFPGSRFSRSRRARHRRRGPTRASGGSGPGRRCRVPMDGSRGNRGCTSASVETSAGAWSSKYFPEYPASVTSTGFVVSRMGCFATASTKSATVGPTGIQFVSFSLQGSSSSQAPRSIDRPAPPGASFPDSTGQSQWPAPNHPSGTVSVKRSASPTCVSVHPGWGGWWQTPSPLGGANGAIVCVPAVQRCLRESVGHGAGRWRRDRSRRRRLGRRRGRTCCRCRTWPADARRRSAAWDAWSSRTAGYRKQHDDGNGERAIHVSTPSGDRSTGWYCP